MSSSSQAQSSSKQEAAKPADSKPAPAKKKERSETPIYKFYPVKDGRVERLRKECPRCGRGVFLAEHKDRLTCGKCGYTSFKRAPQQAQR